MKIWQTWVEIEAKRIVDRLYYKNPSTRIHSIQLHQDIVDALTRAMDIELDDDV